MRFTDFNFHSSLLEGIEASNYETATPVQEQVIPVIMGGKDLIASAQTGTGKTAAFLLPVIDRLLKNHKDGKISALVIVPTRELAIQIAQHLEGLSYFTHISSAAVYGGNDGQNFIVEKKALQSGSDIIICTPGRMIAHLNMGYVSFKDLQFLILDEADRMLDMGFQDDINRIIKAIPAKRQTLLFSATMPPRIRQLAQTILVNPVEVNIAISRPPEKIIQKAFVVYDHQKPEVLNHILKTATFKSALIFCGSKQLVKQLRRSMHQNGFAVEEMHSDLEQVQRENVIAGFASGRIPVLIATDIVSRGIDIDTIDLVINYDVPRDGEDYVHRIGRTARAEADGLAYTIIGEKEQNSFAAIESLVGKEVEKTAIPGFLGKVPLYQPGKKRNGRGKMYGKRKFYKRSDKR